MPITNIYLHGWGRSYKDFVFCDRFLKSENSLFIDFPPFGKSDKKVKEWSIFTYVNMVLSLVEHLKIGKFNLIGHSFGGRVSILIAVLSKNQTNKMILVDSAGLKPKRKLSYYIKVYKYKRRKKQGKDVSTFGSEDFKKLDEDMKKVFSNIVNTHLDDFLPYIKTKTLVVFGEKDKTTPLYMAKKLNRKIKGSSLLVLKKSGHFCFLEKQFEFVSLTKKFLEEE